MSANKIYSAPRSLELENFVFNPIAVINVCPTIYLICREEHVIKDAMDKFTNPQKEDSEKCKLMPKEIKSNSKDGKLFRQKCEEKSVIVTKVTTYQLKILSLMDDLIHILRKPSTFIDQIDRFKQRKLFTDFIARFSRNYIYEIDRIIEEIQFYQIDHYSYFERSTNHLISKVCNLFAVIMRALQMYQKQLAKMNNENSEKLLHFIELVANGINLSIESKIFDEDDMLIKLLLEKTDEFIAFLQNSMHEEGPSDDKQETKASISATTLAKDIYIPTTHRYEMYASKSKKIKPTASLAKVKGIGKCPSNVSSEHQRSRRQRNGKMQTMFASQVGSVDSSTCDAYEEAVKQNNMQVNGEDIDVNYCESDAQSQTETSGNDSEFSSFDGLEFKCSAQ